MEKLLITKLVRTANGHADLYARGHQYPDLKLFDLSDLGDVGLDYEGLEVGAETPCRFYALYELSEKLNKAGNPYKDVVALEPVGAPATTTSTDTSGLLAELRAIRGLLEVLVTQGQGAVPALPEPGPPDTPFWPMTAEEQRDWEAEKRSQAETVPDAADSDEDGPPMGCEALLERMNAETDGFYTSAGHLLYGIRKQANDQGWAWPITTDAEGWAEAFLLATAYAAENA